MSRPSPASPRSSPHDDASSADVTGRVRQLIRDYDAGLTASQTVADAIGAALGEARMHNEPAVDAARRHLEYLVAVGEQARQALNDLDG